MNPFDPRASLEARTVYCKFCGDPIAVGPGERAPVYCRNDGACFRAAKAIREQDRVKDLREHGLCPRCKQPIPGATHD